MNVTLCSPLRSFKTLFGCSDWTVLSRTEVRRRTWTRSPRGSSGTTPWNSSCPASPCLWVSLMGTSSDSSLVLRVVGLAKKYYIGSTQWTTSMVITLHWRLMSNIDCANTTLSPVFIYLFSSAKVWTLKEISKRPDLFQSDFNENEMKESIFSIFSGFIIASSIST